MAILSGPLFGTEGRGRIRNSVVFFRRLANSGYSGEDPGEWYHLGQKISVKQSGGSTRMAWKQKFSAGVAAWKALTYGERAAYNAEAEGLLTGFNVFMSEYMLA